jgi:hypothetical protein
MKTSWVVIVILILATMTNCNGPSTMTSQPSPTATIPPVTPTRAGIPLTFVTIDQEDSSRWPWNKREPRLFLARDKSELGTFTGYLPEEVQADLETTDWDSHFVLAAFPGVQPTHGFQVSIRGIRALPDTISIEAMTARPVGEALPQEATPYHIVRVNRDAAHLGAGITVVFFLDGIQVQSFSLE